MAPEAGGAAALREVELYPPVKAYLEAQGYEVKGEIGACDVVAVRGDEQPIVVELKTSFTLGLVFQGVERQRVADLVYLAVPTPAGKAWRGARYKDVRRLCARLGLGLLAVSGNRVSAHLDPGAQAPRRDMKGRQRLLREFERRVGDPMAGGSTRKPVMTAYRQRALRCARRLAADGPTRARDIGVEDAATLMRRDVYGWFERVERGVYAITPKGRAALVEFAEMLAALD